MSWAGGPFGARGRVRARAQRVADDARRHQHLGAARARRDAVGRGRPGAAGRGAPRRRRGGGRRRRRRAAHPPPPRPLRGRQAVRGAGRLRRPRARPGVPARLEGLGEGDVVAVGDLEVRVVATPGHTADSLSFVMPSERAVLTGDTVLGRGTTVVAHPDGQLGAYLGSLDRLHALAEAHEIATIWPGHGPVIDDALPALDYYLAHRRERLAPGRGRARRARLRTPRPAALTDDGPPAPDRRDRVRRRRPGPLARRRALRPRPAGLPATRLVELCLPRR